LIKNYHEEVLNHLYSATFNITQTMALLRPRNQLLQDQSIFVHYKYWLIPT